MAGRGQIVEMGERFLDRRHARKRLSIFRLYRLNERRIFCLRYEGTRFDIPPFPDREKHRQGSPLPWRPASASAAMELSTSTLKNKSSQSAQGEMLLGLALIAVGLLGIMFGIWLRLLLVS